MLQQPLQPQLPTGFLIGLVRSRIRQYAGERARAHGLTTTQFWILVILDEQGPMTLGALSNRVCIDAPAASRVVEGMVKAGQLRRTTDPGDRRKSLLALTKVGQRAVAPIRDTAAEVRARVTLSLTAKEHATLRSLLDKVLAGFDCDADHTDG
jgi:DNA-binding MarR family transcriptional regulator